MPIPILPDIHQAADRRAPDGPSDSADRNPGVGLVVEIDADLTDLSITTPKIAKARVVATPATKQKRTKLVREMCAPK